MKRELKDVRFLMPNNLVIPAAAQIPMKRELKGIGETCMSISVTSCSPNPYEEGTESKQKELTIKPAGFELQPKSL